MVSRCQGNFPFLWESGTIIYPGIQTPVSFSELYTRSFQKLTTCGLCLLHLLWPSALRILLNDIRFPHFTCTYLGYPALVPVFGVFGLGEGFGHRFVRGGLRFHKYLHKGSLNIAIPRKWLQDQYLNPNPALHVYFYSSNLCWRCEQEEGTMLHIWRTTGVKDHHPCYYIHWTTLLHNSVSNIQ